MKKIFLKKLKLIVKYYFLTVFAGIIFHFIKDYFKILENQSLKSFDIDKNSFEMFILIAVLAPVLEEFIFRFPLKKSPLFYLSLLASVIFIPDLKSLNLIIGFSIFIYWGALFWFQNTNSRISFIFVSTSSLISFGLVHATNFNDNFFEINNIVNILLLFSSQLFLGIFLQKIRIESGFLSSVILHSFYNITFFAFSIIFS